MTVLSELQQWFLSQCDGDWEHGYGVRIETLDNPGWWVRIDLFGTTLDGCAFTRTSYGLGDALDLKTDLAGRVLVDDPAYSAAVELSEDPNWLDCQVKENRFEGAGGPGKLEEILRVFLTWAADSQQAQSPTS